MCDQGLKPFTYSHLGSLVFLGGESASMDLTGVDTILEKMGNNNDNNNNYNYYIVLYT